MGNIEAGLRKVASEKHVLYLDNAHMLKLWMMLFAAQTSAILPSNFKAQTVQHFQVFFKRTSLGGEVISGHDAVCTRLENLRMTITETCFSSARKPEYLCSEEHTEKVKLF